MIARAIEPPVHDLGLRQGVDGCGSPTEVRAQLEAYEAWVAGKLTELSRANAQIARLERRNSDLELRLRGVPWRAP